MIANGAAPLLLLVLLQGLFSILFFIYKSERTSRDRIVVLFLIALFSLMMLKFIKSLIGGPLPFFTSLVEALPLTFGPFLYLYICYSIDSAFPGRLIRLVHFIPSGVVLLLDWFLGFSVHNPTLSVPPPVDFGNPPSSMPPPGGSVPGLIVFIVINLSYVIYTILIVRRLAKHGRMVGDCFSYQTSAVSLSWLRWITVLFFLVNAVIGLNIIISVPGSRDSLFHPALVEVYGLGAFLFAFTVFSVRQISVKPGLSRPDAAPDPEAVFQEEMSNRYKRSGLKRDAAREYLKQLEKYMEDGKPYLQGDLTIGDVSSALGMSRHHLTQILNEQLHCNFFSFINKYRVEEVVRQVQKGKCGRSTLLGIALDAGFSSKSTFNRVFLEHTGMTPSQYRKRLLRGV